MLMTIMINAFVEYATNQKYIIRRSWSGEDVSHMDGSYKISNHKRVI